MHLRVMRFLVAAVLAASWSCGGDGDEPSPTVVGPTPTPIAQPGQGGTVLPYGQVSASDVSCPGGSPAGSTCTRLSISCPSVASAGAVVRVTRPAPTMTNRGTIVLVSGGDGTFFTRNLSSLAANMIGTFASEGLMVADLAWAPPGIWGGPQARSLACRSATAFRWVYDSLHAGGRARLFAAQGTSGGASQIAFALAHYGLGDVLDLANLGSGPPGCPLCSPDGQHGFEPLLPADRAVNREPLLVYPATAVRIFLGDQEPTAEIAADARAYYGAVRSAKSFTVVPGTGHHIEDTQAGVNAFIASVRGALK